MNNMTISEAAAKMREHFAKMDQEKRDYIIEHFVEHLIAAGMPPSSTFLEAFELASEPFKSSEK